MSSSSHTTPSSRSPSKAAKSAAKLSPSKIKGGVKKLVNGLRRSVSRIHLRSRSESHATQAPVSIAHSEVRPGPLTSTSTIIIPVNVFPFAPVPIPVPVSPSNRYRSNSLARSYAKASSDGHSSRDDSSSISSQPISPVSVSRTRSRSSSYSARLSQTSSSFEDVPPVPPLPPSIVPRRAPTPGPTPTIEAFSVSPALEPSADSVQNSPQSHISGQSVIVEVPVEEAEISPVVQAPTELAAPVFVAEADSAEEPILVEEQPTLPVVEETSLALLTAITEIVTTPSEEGELSLIDEQVTRAVIGESQRPPALTQIEEEDTPIEEPIMVDQPVSVPIPVEEPTLVPESPVTEERIAEEAFTPSSPVLAPVVVEPEVPDPFIIDDTDQPLSEEEEDPKHDITPVVVPMDVDVNDAAPSDVPVPPEDDTHLTISAPEEDEVSPDSDAPEDEIALTQSISVQPEQSQGAHADPVPIAHSPLIEAKPSPVVDKPLPTPAPVVVPSPVAVSTSDEDDDEDDYEIILPGVNAPTMFLPIPNTDPLTTLLTKYISPDKRPHRDLSGEWQRTEFHSLVMTNSWRALARMARDRIVATDPEDTSLILSLWYLRLSSLARLRLFNQTSAELTNLYTILTAPSIPPASAEFLFDKLIPFELEVLRARVKYWSGDQMSYLDELVRLVTKCKTMSRKACTATRVKGGKRGRDDVGIDMWKERGTRVCLILASQLIEMKDYAAATSLLTPLLSPPKGTPRSPILVSAVARVYLQSGLLREAARLFAEVVQDPTASPTLKSTNAALLAAAEGDLEKATHILRGLVNADEDNFVAVNNLAVALLTQGHLKEGIDLLEEALESSPSTLTTAEPILFNLSTLYELRSNTAADKKRELLVEVAKWAGDGLRTTCLKMPSA